MADHIHYLGKHWGIPSVLAVASGLALVMKLAGL